MSRLVYVIFLLVVVEGSRNTLERNTETNATEAKVEGKGTIKLPPNVTIPGIITFGDSIVDSGNNNHLRTALKCNFPPYGKDFPGKIAIGRFSDGRVPSDIVAERLGIAETIPAYLNPKLKNEDLLKGVNFCFRWFWLRSVNSKTSVIFSLICFFFSAMFQKVVSLSDQLKYFQEYKNKLKVIVGEEKANFLVKNSLYLVVASSNDIAHTYTARSIKYNKTSYADYLADSASKFVSALYGLGARRIGVFSAVPVGCVPAARTLRGKLKRRCSEKLNEVARNFNAKISPTLEALGKELPDSRVVLIDVYDTLNDMIENPKNYGFEVSNRGCCGTGLVEVLFLCNKINPFTCKNSSSYIFWDSYHPTEKAYQIIVDKLLGNYITKLV
ncbi:GDSL esterase/lipase [Arabidopsis thaliana]